MNTPMLAALLLAAAAAPSLCSADAFVADSHALLAAAKAAVKADKTIVKSSPKGGITYEPSCTTIKFGPNDALTSKSETLSSQAMREVCIPTGPVGQSCHTQPEGAPNRMDVRITITDRPALNPGERDEFEVCLTGSWLSTRPGHTTYEYTVVKDGSDDGDIVVKAGKKK